MVKKKMRSCLIIWVIIRLFGICWNSAVIIITYIPNYDGYIPFREIYEFYSFFGGELPTQINKNLYFYFS